jgi:hypothetical protein
MRSCQKSFKLIPLTKSAGRLTHTPSRMSPYASEYPDVNVNPAIREFFEQFYKTSDTPDAHQQYADSFTENATLVMASKTVKGRTGMTKHVLACGIAMALSKT